MIEITKIVWDPDLDDYFRLGWMLTHSPLIAIDRGGAASWLLLWPCSCEPRLPSPNLHYRMRTCSSLPSATSQAAASSLPFPLMASPAASQVAAIPLDSSKKSEMPLKPSIGGSEANPSNIAIGRITISGRSVLSRFAQSTSPADDEPTSK